ncbi:MAG TPA: crotonase/enoyl-CoA hydratase family protein [Streptosporangiaceae bacterium]
MSVLVERDGPVTTVMIDRPGVRNAVDGATAVALADAFREFDADPDSAVAVLTGSSGTFCSGADLRAVGMPAGNKATPDGDGPMGPTRMVLSKPVIAALAGHAVAGGLELALWCDLRVAEEDAVLGVFCRRWGVPLIDGGTVRLPRLIGQSRALDLILTGRPVKADEALSMGLVNRVVPPGQAITAAQALASELAKLPQVCMRNDRLSVIEGRSLDEETAMEAEFRYGQQSLAAPELAGGLTSFRAGAGRHGDPA